MNGKSDKLKPSLPLYYRLEAPERLKPVHILSPNTMLLLDVLGYMAMQDIDPLNYVLDTMKVFSIKKYKSEASLLHPSQLSSGSTDRLHFSMLIQHGFLNWDERRLDEINDSYIGNLETIDRYIKLAGKIVDLWEHFNLKNKKLLLKSIFKRIYVRDKRILKEKLKMTPVFEWITQPIPKPLAKRFEKSSLVAQKGIELQLKSRLIILRSRLEFGNGWLKKLLEG